MEYITLPNTDMRVSRVCLGTMSLVAADGSVPEPQAIEVVHAALDQGINFFDSAEAYCDFAADAVLGKALELHSKPREEVFIAGKFGRHQGENNKAYSAADIEAALERSLTALRTEYIDLYQIHWPVNMLDMHETVQTLERLKSDGKVCHYGVSNFGPNDLRAFLEAGGRPVTNQLPYNLLARGIEFEVLPLMIQHGISVLCYSSLGHSLLTGRYSAPEEVPEVRRRSRHFKSASTSLSRHNWEGGEAAEAATFEAIRTLSSRCASDDVSMPSVALQWLLMQPGVGCVLVGASKSEQIIRSIDSVQKETVPAALLEEATNCTNALKDILGTEIDLWATTSRIH